MLKIRQVAAYLSVFMLCHSGFLLADDLSGLKLVLETDKSDISANESVNVGFRIENLGDKPLYINKRFYIHSETAPEKDREIYLEVISPSGEKLPCKYSFSTGFPRTAHFELLEPGASVSSERPRSLRVYFDTNQPGTYKVTAFYRNVYGKEIGIDAFTGELVSEPVFFNVTE